MPRELHSTFRSVALLQRIGGPVPLRLSDDPPAEVAQAPGNRRKLLCNDAKSLDSREVAVLPRYQNFQIFTCGGVD